VLNDVNQSYVIFGGVLTDDVIEPHSSPVLPQVRNSLLLIGESKSAAAPTFCLHPEEGIVIARHSFKGQRAASRQTPFII
jgi:hypothetical protein